MSKDEGYVLSVWQRAELCPRESKTSADVEYAISLGGHWFTTHTIEWLPTEAEAWSLAAEFTRNHLEQVRQLRREIEVLTEYAFSEDEILGMAQINADRPNVGFDATRDHHALCRIRARLEAELATLTRGIRPEALEGVTR